MPLGTPAPPNKRRKANRIITDLSHVTQDEYDSEPEASEFDLGTKIRTPKDIMLEELSLMNNRGSKMFKRRQQRVERFIYENNPDLFSSESMENFQKLVPSLGGQMTEVGGHLVGKLAAGQTAGGAPLPPPKPGSKGTRAGAGGAGAGAGAGAGGAGGIGGAGRQGGSDPSGAVSGSGWSPLKGGGSDDPTKKQTHIRTYISPWEKAMKGDESLTATLKSKMPGPLIQVDLPNFRCFNRSAMPFGGYEKANQLLKFQLPDIEATKEEPEPVVVYQHDIGCRPSFNRTPIGWVCSSEPCSIHMETDAVAYDGETDDL